MDKKAALDALITSLKQACLGISRFLRDGEAVSGSVGTSNPFGDAQLKADMYSDHLLFESIRGLCVTALSEETPVPQAMGGSYFIVTFDPLDGSSIIDTNFSVGTMIGIWDSEELIGATGRDLIWSAIVVYGSRTTMLAEEKEDWLAKDLAGSRVCEYTLRGDQWVKSKDNLRIKRETKLFAPANLRAVNESPGYRALVAYWMDHGFTLRYTGGMVPDVAQIFLKGSGVFSNPTTEVSPPKLRILYESGPIARLVEAAGGLAYYQGRPVLDVVITGYEQKVGMCVGSAAEVERFNSLVG